jgi:hypothetical protein
MQIELKKFRQATQQFVQATCTKSQDTRRYMNKKVDIDEAFRMIP